MPAVALPCVSTSSCLRKFMIVCHCNLITDKEIAEIVRKYLREDPWQLIVPAKIFRAAENRGRCCGCVPNMVDIITRVTEDFHLAQAGNPQELQNVRARLEALNRQRKGGRNERRGK